jgi:hypothetical protein
MSERQRQYDEYVMNCYKNGVQPYRMDQWLALDGYEPEARQQPPSAPAPKAEGRIEKRTVKSMHENRDEWAAKRDKGLCRFIYSSYYVDGIESHENGLYTIYSGDGSSKVEWHTEIIVEWLTPAPSAPPAESVGDSDVMLVRSQYGNPSGQAPNTQYALNLERGIIDLSTIRNELYAALNDKVEELAASREEVERLRGDLDYCQSIAAGILKLKGDVERGFYTHALLEIEVQARKALASQAAGEEA